MKTISVRELRSAIPRLRETLALEQELVLLSKGEPVARILPFPGMRSVPSLADHRAKMPVLPAGTIATLLRGDRDRR